MVVDTYQAVIQEELANPLLHYKRLVPFDKIDPDHFYPAILALEEEVLPLIEELEATEYPSWESVILPLEEVEEKIHHVVGPMAHLKAVKDFPRLREAWIKVDPLINQLELRIKQSQPLFEIIEAIRQGEEWN